MCDNGYRSNLKYELLIIIILIDNNIHLNVKNFIKL